MIRFHKRHLKQVRAAKKANGVQDPIGGTGLRFCSDAVGLSIPAHGTHSGNWLLNHPGQVMESALHDRTKWASSKRKSRMKKARQDRGSNPSVQRTYT